MKHQNRNARGFSHHFLLPILAVLLVAGIGSYVMVQNSSASTKTYTYNVTRCKEIGVIRTGSKGSCVRVLQKSLNNWGKTKTLAVDGSFGGNTRDAVKAFQKNKNLTVDGIVGNQTWGALKPYSATVKITVSSSSNTKKTTVTSCKYTQKTDKFTCSKKTVEKGSAAEKSAKEAASKSEKSALNTCISYRNGKGSDGRSYYVRSCQLALNAAKIKANN